MDVSVRLRTQGVSRYPRLCGLCAPAYRQDCAELRLSLQASCSRGVNAVFQSGV